MKKIFNFPMSKPERVLGCIYIPIHVALSLFVSLALSLMNIKFNDVNLMLIWYTLSFVLILLIAHSFLRKSFSDLLDSFMLTVQSVILGYALYFVMVFAISLVFARLFDGYVNPNTKRVRELVRQNRAVMTVVSVVLAPIIEETMFRGALFGTIRLKSRAVAYIVSALLFAAYHIWPDALGGFSPVLLASSLPYAAAAVALAWCYEHSGTVWAPILLHAVVNFISIRGV